MIIIITNRETKKPGRFSAGRWGLQMKRRRIGNYLKKYPNIYVVFQREIKRENIYKGIAGGLTGIPAVFFLFFLVAGYKDGIAFFGMLLAVIFLGFLIFAGTSGKIDKEELLLIDHDFAGRVEEVKGFGYQTEESLVIGLYRIPVKDLESVSYDKIPMGRSGLIRIDMDFGYEDGRHCRAELLKKPEDGDDEKLAGFIRKYDENIKVCKQKR